MKETLKNVIKAIISNKSLSKKILIGLIIFITAIIILASLKDDKYGNSFGNSNNYGLSVQDGRWIYYIEIDDDKPVGICRVKNNGKKIEKVTDGMMSSLNIIDNYIYCIEYDENEEKSNLIKIKTNGKNKKVLANNIDERFNYCN